MFASHCFTVSFFPKASSIALPGPSVGDGGEEEEEGSSNCPEGWQAFGGNCYFVDTTALDFDAAEANCVGKEAALVSIHSQEEQDFVRGEKELA